jgi:hypothetical protein
VASELTFCSLPVLLPKPPSIGRKSSPSSSKESTPVISTASKSVSFDLSNESIVNVPELPTTCNSIQPFNNNLLGLVSTAAYPGQEQSTLSYQNGHDLFNTDPSSESSFSDTNFFSSLLSNTSSLDPSSTSTATDSLPMSMQDIFGTDNGAYFDFDQFLNTDQVDGPVAQSSDLVADRRQVTFGDSSVFPSSTAMSRQPSSESEGSALLDFNNSNSNTDATFGLDPDFNPKSNLDATFGLDLDLLTGAPPPSYEFTGGAGDPTMAATFGSGFGFPSSAADMSDYAEFIKSRQTTYVDNAQFAPDQQSTYVDNTEIASGSGSSTFPSFPTFISPAQLSSSLESTPDLPTSELPNVKRKMSDSSSSSQPKKRGRPSKTTFTAASSPCSKPKRQASKPTVAKPKAVVPQKYLRDGTAQGALGMSEEQILAYPDFDTLLLDVRADLQTRAVEFGQLIENGRRQAAESAQMNRAAKDAKLNGLADEVHRMALAARQLLDQGILTEAQFRQIVPR